jgi:RNase adapter protein RapZ
VAWGILAVAAPSCPLRGRTARGVAASAHRQLSTNPTHGREPTTRAIGAAGGSRRLRSESEMDGRSTGGSLACPEVPTRRIMGPMTEATTTLVVITGMSGAGRRTAAHVLEDMGWYVVDNLPPSMLGQLLRTAADRFIYRIAAVLDVRTRSEFEQIPRAFDELGALGVSPHILFLDSTDEVLVRRQSSVRRPHPLQEDGTILEGIERERRMLARLRAAADLVIDTTALNVHEFAARITHAFAGPGDSELRVTVQSFGFKNGVPIDADMVFDARFLPNPFWQPDLRPLTGLTEAVSTYVLSQNGGEEVLDAQMRLVEVATAGYLREGKHQVTLAIGCTGGKHRSTALVEELGRRLVARGYRVHAIHRDLGLE